MRKAKKEKQSKFVAKVQSVLNHLGKEWNPEMCNGECFPNYISKCQPHEIKDIRYIGFWHVSNKNLYLTFKLVGNHTFIASINHTLNPYDNQEVLKSEIELFFEDTSKTIAARMNKTIISDLLREAKRRIEFFEQEEKELKERSDLIKNSYQELADEIGKITNRKSQILPFDGLPLTERTPIRIDTGTYGDIRKVEMLVTFVPKGRNRYSSSKNPKESFIEIRGMTVEQAKKIALQIAPILTISRKKKKEENEEWNNVNKEKQLALQKQSEGTK